MAATEELTGIKLIGIQASTVYPVVSAYEYEFLKGEEAVRERVDGCTLYLIVQRPLTYFTNLRPEPGGLRFDIVDDIGEPLGCYLPFTANDLCPPDDSIDMQLLFLKKEVDQEPPFNDLGGFRLYKEDGEFIVWLSPQKFIYEVLAGNLTAEFDGDPLRFSDYRVHYIGKAVDQKVWNRLTGHEKLLKILTLENHMSDKREARAPWEISIIMLGITGFDEMNVGITWEFMVPKGLKPITYPMNTDEEVEKFYTAPLQPTQAQLTTEMETGLISAFKPEYNGTKYKKYPNVAGGTRDAGFTNSHFSIERLPVILYTDHHRLAPIY